MIKKNSDLNPFFCHIYFDLSHQMTALIMKKKNHFNNNTEKSS